MKESLVFVGLGVTPVGAEHWTLAAIRDKSADEKVITTSTDIKTVNV